mmetsp:Transcript_24159/g.44382  ORF Transcript_24159/g.44382 Transcript_24159/m.44382 type:complete len:88 (-) Transcript_24159:27-290(-)
MKSTVPDALEDDFVESTVFGKDCGDAASSIQSIDMDSHGNERSKKRTPNEINGHINANKEVIISRLPMMDGDRILLQYYQYNNRRGR